MTLTDIFELQKQITKFKQPAYIINLFDENGEGAIVNSSRGIIAAHTKDAYREFGPEGYAQAARAASLDMIEDLRRAIADR